ncbi:hypothetical protein BJ878DRAFT_480098 [Calycina marina]|uniref:EamA domain-containing protein n=1 Tax=Calycina marina TaxID=1763456 RepID=A0A9P7Z348_9HELO|nr:hypothetical protein BJ878DRAFT_480098 [Calycina marina]
MSYKSHPPAHINAPSPASPTTTSRHPLSYSPHRTSSRAGTPLRLSDDFARESGSESEVTKGKGMGDRRPAYHRPSEGRSHLPLLNNKDNEERGRSYDSPVLGSAGRLPMFTRRSTMRSRSPDTQAKLDTKQRYTYAALLLGLSLVSFVVQTETAVYIQHELKWNKAYCMLYFTHGSWSLLWPVQLLILRIQKWSMPWEIFWRRHVSLLRTTAQMVETQQTHVHRGQHSPVPYILRMTAFITCALTVAGGSWYVAVNLTSPSDLTAIYNCSAFFAYAFSVPLLKEKLRWGKSFAVLVAIIGVLIVAYGDAAPTKHGGKSGGSVGGDKEVKEATSRVAGNLIIGVGSVLYGFYEVLYKKLACPPDETSPGRGMIFAMTFGSLIGSFTLLVLWIPLPILHIIGWEIFELPQGKAAWLLIISVLANATFSGSFLILISLTSPVLSSVAALLTIFLVAITDWVWTGIPLSPAAMIGGLLIIGAFLLLSWSTFREMQEEKSKKQVDLVDDETDRDSDA